MKKLNHFLNILTGAFVGVFVGRVLYVCWDVKNHPALYAVRSAPWYTSIFVYGAVTLTVVLAAIVVKLIIRSNERKG